MAYLLSNVESPPNSGLLAQSRMFYFKNLLKSAGWSVTSSGDGISVYSSTGDILTGLSTGASGIANNRSWFAIRSPDLANSFVFQNTVAGGTTGQWRIKWSPGGTFNTGGSATTSRSASNEVVVVGGGTNSSPTGTSFGTNSNVIMLAVASNTSPYTFWSVTRASSFYFDSLVSCFSGDASPYVWVDDLAGPFDAVRGTFPSPGISPSFSSKFFAPSATPTTLISSSTYRYGFGGGDLVGAQQYSSGWNAQLSGGVAPDPLSGADILSPVAYLTSLTSPGWKGLSQSIYWRGAMRSSGSTHTLYTLRDRIYMGYLSLPWDGSVPIF